MDNQISINHRQLISLFENINNRILIMLANLPENLIVKYQAIAGDSLEYRLFSEADELQLISLRNELEILRVQYTQIITKMLKIPVYQTSLYKIVASYGCIEKAGIFNDHVPSKLFFLTPFVSVRVYNKISNYSLSLCYYGEYNDSKMLSTAMKLSKYLWFIPGESITTQDNIFHDIYFPPDIASLIFHEVIGHAFEGDTYFSMESPLCKFHFGERICISGIDIINISNGMWLGAEGFDDEGTVGKYQYLVHNGIFVDLMVDNYLAKKYHLSPCGNCRSAYPFHTTNIRMTNFVVQRCNDSHLILNDQIIQWVAYEPKLLYAMNNP